MRARWHLVGVGAAAVVTAALFAGSALAATITSFTPRAGLAEDQPYCPGGHVTITGTGFVSDGGVTAVTFGGGVNAVDVQVGSDTTIYVMVPKGAKSGPIVVTTKAGSATTATLSSSSAVTPIGEISLPTNVFTVNECWGRTAYDSSYSTAGTAAKASITSFSPTKGKAGVKVTVTGANFSGVTAVKFAGVKATFKVVSATKIMATVPAKAKTGKISVTTAAGTTTSAAAFTKL